MKTTEAWSSGIYPHLYDWMEQEQIARNREKWRAAVERLGDHWSFLTVQKRIVPTEADRIEAIEKVRNLRKLVK